MKRLILGFLAIIESSIVYGSPSIDIDMGDIGNRAAMQRYIAANVDAYSSQLRIIDEGLRVAQATSNGEQRAVIDVSLKSLDAIMQRQDVEGASGLLPLVNLLHTHNTDESPRILPTIDNASAQGTLNYLIDGIYTARITGAADLVGEQEMESMLRFYAGNPAQTSEGSWQTTNTMLFVFGDRVINTLVKKAPDRIDAFYKAVQDARKSAQSGLGADEEAIPNAERPTAEQLRAYEASFGKLEELATKGVLPKSDLPSQTPMQAQPLPQAVPTVPPSPKQSAESKPLPTRNEELTSSTPWSVIVILMAAAIGLAWLLLKHRK
jgi:hypothetical protein